MTYSDTYTEERIIMADVNIKTVHEFFKIGDGSTNSDTGDARNRLSGFANEWKALSQTEKDQLKSGLGDGTFDYVV